MTREWLLNVRNMVLLCGSVVLIVAGMTLLIANVILGRDLSTFVAPSLISGAGVVQLIAILRSTRVQRQLI